MNKIEWDAKMYNALENILRLACKLRVHRKTDTPIRKYTPKYSWYGNNHNSKLADYYITEKDVLCALEILAMLQPDIFSDINVETLKLNNISKYVPFNCEYYNYKGRFTKTARAIIIGFLYGITKTGMIKK